jgi:O-antigen ligase
VWTLVAFGGVYTWTLPPAALAIAAAAILLRPRIFTPTTRVLDTLLVLCVAGALLQLVPLPASVRAWVSPEASMVERTLRLDAAVRRSRPLSLDPALTLQAIAIAAMMIGAFWTARDTFARGGIRTVVRAVCWAGLVISLLAIATHYASPRLFYGIWPWTNPQTSVYGPFVNRNHMGTWLVLAIPLSVGYLAARVARRGSLHDGLDAVSLWVAGAACMMFAALIVSLSRSAAVSIGVAAAAGGVIAVGRHGGHSRKWLLAAAAAAAVVFVSIPMSSTLLLTRFDRLKQSASGGRSQIWVETLPIIHDFAIAGTGLGTYRMTMLVYQRTERDVLFNQAHDEYLQLAAEGGLLVGVPLLLAAVVLIAGVARRLRDDISNGFWIRAGAVASLAGVMTQNIWETGLRMPANGLLFAIVCAIAVHGSQASAAPARAAVAPSNDRGRARMGGRRGA